ncbi:MAG: HsdM family class I SAM-dependent methyltransferase [bacterium]
MSTHPREESLKWRGAFYTPVNIASFLVNWAVRSRDDIIFDPGCGEAVFLLQAYRRLLEIGAEPQFALEKIYGVELDPKAFRRTLELLEAETSLKPSHIFNMDFFEVGTLFSPSLPQFDVVIGNPPYVRYHRFDGAMRAQALQAASRLGVFLPQLTSAWAPYIVHASAFLKESGCLAMVLPAELLHVDYAHAVREFLLQQFKEVTVVTFERRVFPGVLEEVLLLLAEGKEGRSDQRASSPLLRMMQLQGLEDLRRFEEILSRHEAIPVVKPASKWVHHLLSTDQARFYDELTGREEIISLGEVAKVDIGVVTGNNDFFLLSREAIEKWAIEPQFVTKAIRKAVDIPGALFTEPDWGALQRRGEKCHLLHVDLPPDMLRAYRLWNYILHGQEKGVNSAFKCRTREPWYAVPYVRIPNIFLTYMANQIPRLVFNEAGAVSTNTIHGVYMLSPARVNERALVASFYNSLTLLSAELVGRSYGGGVLKLETQEAEKIKLVIPKDTDVVQELACVAPQIDGLLRQKRTDEAIALVDRILLGDYLKLDDRALNLLREAHKSLQAKRMARTKFH